MAFGIKIIVGALKDTRNGGRNLHNRSINAVPIGNKFGDDFLVSLNDGQDIFLGNAVTALGDLLDNILRGATFLPFDDSAVIIILCQRVGMQCIFDRNDSSLVLLRLCLIGSAT
nr:hypothetical protein [Aliifodinibius sp. S!AR15-10]